MRKLEAAAEKVNLLNKMKWKDHTLVFALYCNHLRCVYISASPTLLKTGRQQYFSHPLLRVSVFIPLGFGSFLLLF